MQKPLAAATFILLAIVSAARLGHAAPLELHRRTNIAANPVGWLVGIHSVSLSHGAGPTVAIRGDVTLYRQVFLPIAGYDAILGVPIYLRRLYHGFFIEPSLLVRRWDTGVSGHGPRRYETTIGPLVSTGWHFMWSSGVNLAAAAGVGVGVGKDQEIRAIGNFTVRLGYAF
jgi:hypothetical protein